MIELLNNT